MMHWLFHSFPGQEGDQGRPTHIGSCPHSHRSADGLQRLRCMHLCVCIMCVNVSECVYVHNSCVYINSLCVCICVFMCVNVRKCVCI